MRLTFYDTICTSKAWLLSLVLMFAMLAVQPAWAQNTKGDRPSSSRESRFKPSSKSRKKVSNRPRRIGSGRPASVSRAASVRPRRNASGKERPGRPVRPIFSRKPSNTQKAWRGDITGRRIRGRNRSSTDNSRNVYTQQGTFARKNIPDKPKNTGGRRIFSSGRAVKSRTGKTRNVFPQSGPFVNGSSSSQRRPRTVSNRRTLARLNRLQSAGSSRSTPPGKKKVVPRTASRAYISNKTINIFARFPRPRRKSERASTRDISGRRLRTRNYQTPSQGMSAPLFNPNQFRRRAGDRPYRGASGGYKTVTRPGERAWTGDIASRRIRHRDRSSKRKVEGTPRLPKRVRSASRPGERRTGIRPINGKAPGIGILGLSRYQRGIRGQRNPRGGGSVSGRLWNNRRNAIAGKQPRGGLGMGNYQGNLKGQRPLKGGGSVSGKLWNNRRSAIAGKQPRSGWGIGGYQGNMKGQRPLKGGGSVSGKLWNNRRSAIAGKQPRSGWGIGAYQGNLKGQRPLKGGGSVSGKLWNNRRSAIAGKQPRSGWGMGTYQGNMKGQRPLKGGGSVSGKLWNNRRSAIAGKQPRSGWGMGTYQGNLKGQRPLKGGGSVSGKLWNNRRSAIAGKQPRSGWGIGTYQGNIKGGRPLKGGGSVSGRLWNNRRSPIPARIPTGRDAAKAGGFPGKLRRFEQTPGYGDQGEEFTGTIRTRKPFKGGGSVSGKLWNNREKPLEGKAPKTGREIGTFQGNIKGGRPLKGGGSVSGRLWNNKETPIPGRTPPASARKQSGYPGNLKRFEVQPGFGDQGEEFTGYQKLPRRRKNYIQNEHAAEASILKRRPHKNTYEAEGLQVKVKRRDYMRNKNAAEEATLKLEPTRATKAVAGLQVKVQRRNYVRNKNAAEEATLKLEPTRATKAVAGLQVKVKQYHYQHNPSSHAEALKVREPGRAFARATDYQGNIRMRKFVLFEKNRELHPDAKFMKINKNNVAGEKDALTNFKLWWARLFRKQETQPDHLKEKGRRPRYDKGEQGLWYE